MCVSKAYIFVYGFRFSPLWTKTKTISWNQLEIFLVEDFSILLVYKIFIIPGAIMNFWHLFTNVTTQKAATSEARFMHDYARTVHTTL
jgi:hypothetical protein